VLAPGGFYGGCLDEDCAVSIMDSFQWRMSKEEDRIMRRWFALGFVLVVLFSTAFSQGYAGEGTVFVGEPHENLRGSPNGEKIGELLQGTQLTVLEEKGNWLRVSVTGWIYKPSTTKDRSAIKEKAPTERVPAGSGFYYSNVSFKTGMLGPECVGEITNSSGRDYQIANFILSVYDQNGRLLETAYINVSNIDSGVTKSFQAFLLSTSMNEVAKYKVQFENGL
jgi:hypothetical protein